MAKPLEPWKTLARRELFRLDPRIAVFLETVELPDGRVVDDYCQVEMPVYSIVFAETVEGKFICERQYKHGIRRITLTLPAGHVEAGEEPLAAAQRELMEETGYRCSQWRQVQSFRTHASQGGATVHFFTARGGVKLREIDSDDLEETEIELLTRQDVIDAMRQGEFCVLADVALIALALMPE
ncbi:MAG: ADP-ribose pyrophosphatase [Alphaproteobacteria bacterium]|jgi:ADP-ribose pyrophosphatase|nr:ADP-ribose pyrophosphatase [Alphaproteobacteria bacterium]